jgi:phytoene desaturase
VGQGRAKRVHTSQGVFEADAVVAGSDYAHTERALLAPEHRSYSEAYWDKRTMSPSSLLFYVGLNRRVEGLKHHSLFFDEDFALHAEEIYTTPKWPTKPLFYVCAPSRTDPSVAPEGCENLFFLMPLAPGLADSEEKREHYYEVMMGRFERLLGQPIRDAVVVKRGYAMADFERDYHSFKGNAYGLANTLLQTAFLKPKMRSKKVGNLFYTGQLTVPGPGVPPSLISGQVVAREVAKALGRPL